LTHTPPPSPPPRQDRSWIIALTLIGTAILSLATFAAWQLNRSKHYLDTSLADLKAQGATIDAPGCIQAVLNWRPQCEAMASMCDNSLGQLTDACLSSQDRSLYCDTLRPQDADNHAVNDLCVAFGVDRKQRAEWKQCGMIIEGLRQHCRNLEHLNPSRNHSASQPTPSIAHTPSH
jgi:hypothetical protein